MAATKKTPQQIGKSSRQKGSRGEREVCNILKARFEEDFRRGYQRRVQTDEPDIVGPDWFKYWPECKNMKAPNIVKAYHQAIDETDGRPPLVFSKKTHDKAGWLVTMNMETFLELLELKRSHETGDSTVTERVGRAKEEYPRSERACGQVWHSCTGIAGENRNP